MKLLCQNSPIRSAVSIDLRIVIDGCRQTNRHIAIASTRDSKRRESKNVKKRVMLRHFMNALLPGVLWFFVAFIAPKWSVRPRVKAFYYIM